MSKPNDMEWCSLCGQHFTTVRELEEHRHPVDDDDDDEQATSHGAGVSP